MANLVTLAQIRTLAYQIADLENAVTRFPVSEVNTYVNMGVGELYDLLVRTRGEFFQSQYTITTDGVNVTYALPSDFMELTLAQLNLGMGFNGSLADVAVPLYNFTMGERPELASSTPSWTGSPLGYRLHSGTVLQANTTQGTIPTQYAIELLPKPSANQKILLFYVPIAPQLVNDNDTIDSINQWHVYAAAFAARMMRTKDDLPTTAAEALMESIKERVNALGPHRDAYTSKRVTDVRRAWPARRWARRRLA